MHFIPIQKMILCGRITVHAVISRLLAVEIHFQSQATRCGIDGGQSDTETRFSPITSVFPHPCNSTNIHFLFVCFHGHPRQATDVLQPAGLLHRPLWTFQLWPPNAPAPTDAFRTLAAEVGTYGRGMITGNFD
jgi:hypothetical protein